MLPSPYVVKANGTQTPNSTLIVSAEPISIKPETIVYTLNPKAVWSDGVPITAADFKYAWEQQRGDPDGSSTDVDEHRRVPRHRVGDRIERRPHGHGEVQEPVRRLADALRQPAAGARDGEGGVEPELPDREPEHRPVGRAVRDRVGVRSDIRLVQNPKWWGTPANSKSITVHVASSTNQLASWMSSGLRAGGGAGHGDAVVPDRHDRAPRRVRAASTRPPRSCSSTWRARWTPRLSPDLRTAIALSVNRQALVNQQVSWAVPGIAVADSHMYVQGQAGYKPAPTGTVSTTTIPPPTSSTSTTVIGAGGSVNFPVTPVPDQADAFLAALGPGAPAGQPYYGSAFGVPFTLHLVVDGSDPWAAAAAPVIRSELAGGGLGHGPARRPIRDGGRAGAGRRVRRPGGRPGHVQPVPEPDPGLVHDVARCAGQERFGGLDGLRQRAVRAARRDGLPAAQPEHGGRRSTRRRTRSCGTRWCRCPCTPSRAALAWSRSIGGVAHEPRGTSLLWYAQYWAVRQPETTSNTTPSLPGQ